MRRWLMLHRHLLGGVCRCQTRSLPCCRDCVMQACRGHVWRRCRQRSVEQLQLQLEALRRMRAAASALLVLPAPVMRIRPPLLLHPLRLRLLLTAAELSLRLLSLLQSLPASAPARTTWKEVMQRPLRRAKQMQSCERSVPTCCQL